MTQRILVVEDSRTQAERLRLLLTQEGYEVEVALNGKEGLLKARAGVPDLVISDVTMPELDGFAFCRAMKWGADTSAIPIILLTTRTSPTDIMKGLESGADNFIPKTYDDAYVLERVRRISEQLAHRQENRLEMEVNLTVGGRKITVTADRQQIMELLFSTFEEMGRNHDELEHANQQLQAARAEAEQANIAKSKFLSRMSHELRTPLNAVMGFGQLLEMADLEPQERESARLIVAAGRHLLNLINELLDIGRIEAGELTLALEPVRIADVVDEAVELTQLLAGEKNVEVSADFAADGPSVLADRQRLKQVVLNLVSNAIKYNRPGGTVTLGCRSEDDGRQSIEVTDTGMGIAPENLDRLFAPFDRIGAEENTTVEGTGLGLALSRLLVEAMDGKLSVRSLPGQGSTFSVELAAVAGPAQQEGLETSAESMTPADGAEASSTSLRLLHVADNATDVHLVERVLGHRPDIELISARQGRAALELARQHRPAMILLDMELAGPSGEEVLKQLREAPETHAIPTVAVIAGSSEDHVQKLRSIGASACLSKPLDVQRLLEVVDETFARASNA